MIYFMKKWLFFLLIGFSFATFASPREIILLRHTDKLAQSETGPTLSAKGYVRALKFTYYFLNRFGEPDFVIAGKPKGADSSIRELQTVAPLVNILAARYPNTGFDILHPYTHDEFGELSKYILTDKKFDDALVLICWRHTKIVELAKALGVEDKLDPWPDNDYDSVYVIEYTKYGKVARFNILHNQYPINSEVTWDDVYNKLNAL